MRPRFKDKCPHGLNDFLTTINNKDVYCMWSRDELFAFCVRYGNSQNECHEIRTDSGFYSRLIRGIYTNEQKTLS